MKILDLDGIVAWTVNQIKSNKDNGTSFEMLVPLIINRFGVDSGNYWPLCQKFLAAGIDADQLPFASPLVWEIVDGLDTTSASQVTAFIADAPTAYKDKIISSVSRLWRQHSWALTEKEYRSIAPDFKAVAKLNWASITSKMFAPSAYKAVIADHDEAQRAHKSHMEYSNRYQYDKSKQVQAKQVWTGLAHMLAETPISSWPSLKTEEDITLSLNAWNIKLTTAESLNTKEQQKLCSTIKKAMDYRALTAVTTEVISKSTNITSLTDELTSLFWADHTSPSIKEVLLKNPITGTPICNDSRYVYVIGAHVPAYSFQGYMSNAHINQLMDEYIISQERTPSDPNTVIKFWNQNPETLKRLRPYAYSDIYALKDNLNNMQWERVTAQFGTWLKTCDWSEVVSKNIGVDTSILDLLSENRPERLRTIYNLLNVNDIKAEPLPNLDVHSGLGVDTNIM